jgi:cell division protein FtsB
VEERDAARDEVKTLRFDLRRASGEYTRLHDENERLDAEVQRLRKSSDTELLHRLARSEEARTALQGQLETLQKVNESLNAESAAVADQAWREAHRPDGEVTS